MFVSLCDFINVCFSVPLLWTVCPWLSGKKGVILSEKLQFLLIMFTDSCCYNHNIHIHHNKEKHGLKTKLYFNVTTKRSCDVILDLKQDILRVNLNSDFKADG